MITRLSSVRPGTLAAAAGAVVVVAAVLFGVWPLPRVEELGGGPILDTRFLASGTDAAGYLGALGSEGRRLYTILAVGDLLWAVPHGLTVAAGIAVGVTRSRLDDRLAVLAVLALAYLVFDLIENVSILAALAVYPEPQPVPAGVMDLATGLKFITLAPGYLALVVALVAWAAARRGTRRA